ncbi:MAG: NAD(P)H-dependent oxidoreductase [Calditrichota bacterium]
MKKVLILFAHPALEKSRINQRLIEGLDKKDNVTFRDLYELYPDFNIDVNAEQQVVMEHDAVIFHHPFYWYSTPAILKEWQDLVLEHGWAYGSSGNALSGKYLMNVMTAGGGKPSYCAEGFNKYTIRDFLRPIERTAALCKMEYLPPLVLHGTHSLTELDIEPYKETYHNLLDELIADKLEITGIKDELYMNSILEKDSE